MALLAEQTQSTEPDQLGEVHADPKGKVAAPEAQDRSQHLAVLPWDSKSYAPNGVWPVWFAMGAEPVATEEPDEGNLHALRN